jgi:hypothetical protein
LLKQLSPFFLFLWRTTFPFLLAKLAVKAIPQT